MQESSDGSRDFPERSRRAGNIYLFNQTQPQPPQTIASNPVQEGQLPVYGQARLEYQIVDSDGSASLLHDVNQVNAPQNIIQQSRQHPIEASPQSVPSRVVPSQTSAAQGQRQSDTQQPSRRTVQTPSLLNVDVRAEGNRDLTGRFSDGHSNIHGQSMSGFTGNDMNNPSGGHLIPLPSQNLDLHQQRDPQVPSSCILPEAQVESVDSEHIECRLSQAEFAAKRGKYFKSFKDAGYSDDIAGQYADQLLLCLNIDDMVKCQQCNKSQSMSSQFVHFEGCPMHLSSYQAQGSPRNDLQITSRSNGTGHNSQTSSYRGPSGNVPSLPPSLPPSQAISSLPLGAVGGADTLDSETTKLKRMVASGTRHNIQTSSYRRPSENAPSLPPSLPLSQATTNPPHRAVRRDETSDPLNTDECKVLIEEMKFKREDVYQAVQVFNRAPRGKRYSVEELLDILLERIEHQSTPLSLTSRESLRSSTSFNKLNGEQASQAVLMDGSYCSVCNENRVAIIQYECRHVVCKQCKPADFGGPCRICGEKVVKCGAVDSDKFGTQN